VYIVQWSPFNSNVFLSSSTDWDVKIWHQDYPHAAFSLTSPLVSAAVLFLVNSSFTAYLLVRDGPFAEHQHYKRHSFVFLFSVVFLPSWQINVLIN